MLTHQLSGNADTAMSFKEPGMKFNKVNGAPLKAALTTETGVRLSALRHKTRQP